MKIETPEFLQAEFFMRDEKVIESNLPLIKPSQVHEDNILIIDDTNINEFAAPECPKADGIFLKTSKAQAFLRFADCAPVLIWGKKYAMILHSGYKGTVLNISAKGVELFEEPAENLHAWIGPCIGFKYYCRDINNDEWTLKGLKTFHEKNYLKNEDEGKIYFNLAGEIKSQLLEKNLTEENIILSGIDTFENPKCYSYRRGDKTERMTLKIQF